MRAVIQAVSSASVRVNGGEPRASGRGLVILLGVRDTDTLDIVPKLADKCAGLRIFKDENDKLNLSAKDLGYSALVVSQFTLYGDTRKGFRPSFIKAAKQKSATEIWNMIMAMADAAMKEAEKSTLKGADKKQMVIDMVKASCKSAGVDLDAFLDQLSAYIDSTMSFVNGMTDKNSAATTATAAAAVAKSGK